MHVDSFAKHLEMLASHYHETIIAVTFPQRNGNGIPQEYVGTSHDWVSVRSLFDQPSLVDTGGLDNGTLFSDCLFYTRDSVVLFMDNDGWYCIRWIPRHPTSARP